MQTPLLIALITFLFLSIFKFFKPTHTKLPPGPRKLPIIGNLHQFVSKNTLPHRRLAELATVYGPIMHLKLGEVSTVIISSPEMAKEVMKTHDAVFCDRPMMLMPEVLFYGRTDIAFCPYGEYWRQLRKIATHELFAARRVQGFRHVREEEVLELVKCLASGEGSVVNLSNKIFNLNFDIILRLSVNKKGEQGEAFRLLFKDVAEISSGFSIGDLYPSAKFVSTITGMETKLKEFVKRLDKVMDPIIKEHTSKKKQEGQEEEDLVAFLLAFHKDQRQPDSSFSLTNENIKAIVFELFGGASDTISTTMEWAMSELLKNPITMKKAQDEVRQVLREKHLVSESSLDKLEYLKLVIRETLRLHPPFPLLLPRESREACQIGGYEIPTKTRVFINGWAIGRDSRYWKDPESFNPERFRGTTIDYKGNHFELIPFGAGRRICPGMGLSIATIELELAMLLYHFDWKLPNNAPHGDLDMDEAFGISATRKNDLHAIPFLHSYSGLK